MRKLLVASQRSGVGKTTTAINLAAAAAMGGARVLLLEADPMSGVSSALKLADHPDRQPLRGSGVELPGVLCSGVVPGLDVISPYEEGGCSDDHLEQVCQLVGSAPFRDNYDCLIVNAPPFLGARPEPLLAACDEYLVVMQAESMAHRMLPAFTELVQRSAKQSGAQIAWRGILMTLPEGEAPGGAAERELRGRFGTRLLPTVIPYDEEVNKAQMFGHILVHASPDAPAALEYKEVVAQLKLTSGVVAGRTRPPVGDLLVLAGPAVQPIVPRRREPIVGRKSRAAVPVVRPSIPTNPPPPRREPTEAAKAPADPVEVPRPVRPPLRLRNSSAHPSALDAFPKRPTGRSFAPAGSPPAPAAVSTPTPAATPAQPAAPPPTPWANAKTWLPYVLLAVGLGVGLRFLPLGRLLESDLAMPLAVGVATGAATGLGLWVMAKKQPPDAPNPADTPKK